MSDSPFNTFIDLISLDRAIHAVEKQVAAVEHDIRVLRDKEHQLMADVEAAKKVAHDARKAVDQAELDMKSLDQEEKSKKNRLENVTSHKEYQSVKAELDDVREKQHKREQQLMDVWHQMEGANKVYETKQKLFETEVTKVHADIQAAMAQKEGLEASIKEQEEKRVVEEKKVPLEWIEKYAAMRSRVDDPVVPVQQGSCSACFFKISDQDMLLLSRNKLLQCKDCYRFLYIPSPERTIAP